MQNSNLGANPYLLIGGLFSMTFAVFQLSAIFWSDEVLKFFGGPVSMRAENLLMYVLACVVVAAIVALFGLYAFSGAGKFRRLPLLKSILVIITILFLFRGGELYIDLKLMNAHPEEGLLRFAVFSLIALGAGIIHLLGVVRLFKHERVVARASNT